MSMYPYELKYDGSHEWLRLNRDGSVSIGITQFAVTRLTGLGRTDPIVSVTFPPVGAALSAGAEAGSVESTSAMTPTSCPIAGKVLAVNDALATSPGTVADDPYGDGWLFTIQPAAQADLGRLMDVAAYESLVAAGG